MCYIFFKLYLLRYCNDGKEIRKQSSVAKLHPKQVKMNTIYGVAKIWWGKKTSVINELLLHIAKLIRANFQFDFAQSFRYYHYFRRNHFFYVCNNTH